MYKTLTGKDKQVVTRWLERKSIMETGVFDPSDYDALCDTYLTDDKKDHYVIINRGKITASKLKKFIKNPEEYYMRYVLELPPLVEEETKSTMLGKAFDCLMTHGQEGFYNRYYIDKGYVKGELCSLIAKKYGGTEKDRDKKCNLEELRKKRYLSENDKMRLTPAEGKNVLGMYYEVSQQPMFRCYDKSYEKQVHIEANYRGLIVSGTLDRYSSERKEIRDWKTAGRLETFEYDVENTFDYVTSMSFYYVLAYLKDGFESDVFLDVVGSSHPYQSIIYRLSADKLKRKMNNHLKPQLDALVTAHEKNERPSPMRMEVLNSPYYPILSGATITEYIDCN